MTNYPVRCYGEGCKNLAEYKIAARWSHGASSELKTYALACEACLPQLFASSRARQKLARTLPGELGEEPGIYIPIGGWGDREMVWAIEREADLLERQAPTT